MIIAILATSCHRHHHLLPRGPPLAASSILFLMSTRMGINLTVTRALAVLSTGIALWWEPLVPHGHGGPKAQQWTLTFGIHWHWAPLGLFPGAKIWLWAWVPLHARPWQCGLIATIWALILPSLGLQVWVNLANGSPSQPLNVHWGKCGESMWMVGNWLFHKGQDFGQVKSHAFASGTGVLQATRTRLSTHHCG